MRHALASPVYRLKPMEPPHAGQLAYPLTHPSQPAVSGSSLNPLSFRDSRASLA